MPHGYDVIVVGAGPAGLSAALSAAESGAKTLLLERLPRPGVKLLASGGGRCNVGNTLSADEFMRRFGRDGRFMASALELYPIQWTLDFLASKGVPCRAEDGFHYFPESGHAKDILDAFLDSCRKLSVEIRCSSEVASLNMEEKAFSGVILEGGEVINAKTLVIACGGMAWPSLGGCGDGLRLAVSMGHSIETPLPAMAPLVVRDTWVGRLAGVSLLNVSLSAGSGRRRTISEGELLFTHDGISGPAVLDISGDFAAIAGGIGGTAPLTLSIKSGWEAGRWLDEIESWRIGSGRRLVRSALSSQIPASLASELCRIAGCHDEKTCLLKAQQRDSLAKTLEGVHLTASPVGDFSKAMAMKGGVSLKEVSPHTLESKVLKGLFFAGETLDLVGPCGGYNIQWAISSGRLAGRSAAH